ncbi:MAG TPA: NmrA family NAD(P)-binding protein, partial [Tepidisphaeraceae bacterium]|nr:NmrA family NAD(P)-binding protein [Tepidisphaeraceae bacterium]
MFAIMGITGRVGGMAAQRLLAGGAKVRGIVRDGKKAESWAARGVELAVADSTDSSGLAQAFTGVSGAFVMIPPFFAPAEGFPETRAILNALAPALAQARPGRVVILSSVGAHLDHGLGLITQSHLFEQALRPLGLPIAAIRPAWFMENAAWDVGPARHSGEFQSFLGPLDRAIPMVATADIAQAVADVLAGRAWPDWRTIELAGPHTVSPNDIAAALGRALDKPVVARQIPRPQWEQVMGTNP